MRILLLIISAYLLSSCQIQKDTTIHKPSRISLELNAITQDNDIKGSVLIYDLNKDSYYSNDFKWANKSQLPASTFKIPHSLIALELGIVKDENSLFKWNGDKRNFKIWEQDLTFKKAFHYSCVPCYQEIARKIGEKRMNEIIDRFAYGKMDINTDTVNNFWLIGNSRISQFEEIDFLKRLYLSQLPISKRTEQIFKKIFIVKQTESYILRSKTGLSINNESYNGWYVGYLEKNNNTYFFATNISPNEKYHKSFNKKRKTITIKALEELKIL